jgi:hypothetical protein
MDGFLSIQFAVVDHILAGYVSSDRRVDPGKFVWSLDEGSDVTRCHYSSMLPFPGLSKSMLACQFQEGFLKYLCR